MAPFRGLRRSARRGRGTLRPKQTPDTQLKGTSRGRGGRIEKYLSKFDAKRSTFKAHVILPRLQKLDEVLRTEATIHACSELSIDFVAQSHLETDEDTNIICLNLMDYFLFSADNWLPEFSYCKLHAACFLIASLLTGKNNTVEQIAESLGPESALIQQMALPLIEDEESAAAIPYLISIDINDIEKGYSLLYLQRSQFTRLVGQYASALEELPSPSSLNQKGEPNGDRVEEDNLDVF